MTILDGKRVPASDITEAHRFVGMWRPPVDPMPKILEERGDWDAFVCTCGMVLWTINEFKDRKHWLKGCFDLPQYVSEAKP